MPADLDTPDEAILRQFLLGRLTGPAAERVEQYLESHPEAAQTLQSLAADDTLPPCATCRPVTSTRRSGRPSTGSNA